MITWCGAGSMAHVTFLHQFPFIFNLISRSSSHEPFRWDNQAAWSSIANWPRSAETAMSATSKVNCHHGISSKIQKVFGKACSNSRTSQSSPSFVPAQSYRFAPATLLSDRRRVLMHSAPVTNPEASLGRRVFSFDPLDW